MLGNLMRDTLVLFYNFTGNFGIAIILLTIVVKLILLPLTISQTRSSAAMKKVAPLQRQLQEKYKDNPQIYQEKLLELYKKHNFNPLSGCLPVLVQMPFLWALFGILRTFPTGTPEVFQAGFSPWFFVWNLTVEATKGGSWLYYLLPIISAATTYLQTLQGPSGTDDPTAKTMQVVMPLFILAISLNIPGGLVLYWSISNLFTILQTYLYSRLAVGKGGSEAA